MTIQQSENLIWVDVEATSLDVTTNTILEIAVHITTPELEILDGEGIDIVIHHEESTLEHMSDWAKEHFSESGLSEQVRSSTISMAEAENMLLTHVQKLVPEKTSPLCGNSVHFDRFLIIRHMPKFDSFLHYRNIDVSSIKELAKRWYPEVERYPDRDLHQALSDIEDSIEELKYLREKVFRTVS